MFAYPPPRPARPRTDATSTPSPVPDESSGTAPTAADVAGAVPVDRSGWVPVGDPLTVEQMRARFPYLDRANPERALLNCVFAAIVTDLLVRFGGRDRFEAPASVATEVGVLSFYAGRPVQEADGYQAVIDAMRASPPGSRGVLVVNDAAGSLAHAVNVVRDEHGVFFLDGQTNAPATVPPVPSRVRFVATTADVPAPAVSTAPTSAADADLAGSDHAALFGLQPLGDRPRDLVQAVHAATGRDQEPGPVAQRWGTTDPGRLAEGLRLRLVVVGEDGALRAYGDPGRPEAFLARSGGGYLALTPTAGREPELPGDRDVEEIGRPRGLTGRDGGEPVRAVASELLDAHDGGLGRYRWTLDGHQVNLSALLTLPSVHRHLPRLLGGGGLVLRSDRAGPRAHRFELRLTGRRASGYDLVVDHLASRVDVTVTLHRVGSTTREWQRIVTLTEQFQRTVPLLPLPPSGMPEPTGVPFPVTPDQLRTGAVTVGATRTPSGEPRARAFTDAVPLGFVQIGDHYRLVVRAVRVDAPVELLLDVTAVADLRGHFVGPGLDGLVPYEGPPGYAGPSRTLGPTPEGVGDANWAALRDDPAVDVDRPRWDALTTLAPDVPTARLLSWVRAIGHAPDDVAALADRIGVAPRSLLTLAVDIGVDPQALTVFASRLGRLDEVTVPELRGSLDPYGRITDDDVVAIADIAGRLGLAADALPPLLDFVAYGVPFDLLTALPDTLLAAAVAVAWLRHDIDTLPDRAAEALGLDDRDQVEDLAMALGVLPGHLAVIAPEVRDAVLPDLDVPGSSSAPAAGRAEAVRENLRRSGYLPHDNPAGLTRQLTLAGRLGFHPGQLSFLLPSPHVVLLAHEFLVDVPLQRVELTLRLLAEDLTRPSEALLSGLPRTEFSDAELTEWVDSLTSTDTVAEEFRATARALLNRPWGDLRGATALGYRAGSPELNRFLDVVQVAVASGRMPVDLLRIAHRLNLSPDTVLVAARVIGTDPRYLHPFTAPLLRSELPASDPDHQNVLDVAATLRTYAARRSPLHDEALRVPWMFRQTARGVLGAWGAVVTPAVLTTALAQLGRAEVPESHTDVLHNRGRQLSEATQRFDNDLPADRIGALGDLGGLLGRWMAGLRQITGMHRAVEAAAPGSRNPLRNAVVARDRLERAIIQLLNAQARPTPELRAAWADRDQAVRNLTLEPHARLSRTLPGLLLAVLTADARYARLLSAAVAANLRQRPELREADGTPHPAVAELAGAVESVGRTFEAILQDQPFFQRPDDLSALELDERLANALADAHGSAVQGQRSGEAWLGTYWAGRFADPRFDASTFALDHQARPWLDHGAVLALARAAGQPPWTVHRLVADELERTPVELLDPANRHGVPLGRLLEYAARWYLDPAVFGFLDRAALADDDRHAEYAAQLEDHLNDRDSAVTAFVLARATQGRFAGPPADTLLFDSPTAVALSMGLPRAWGTGDPVPREALVEFDELEVSLIALMDVQEPSIVLAAELGVPAMWVALVGTRVGRVPLDLAAHAARLGVADPLLLFALVAELGVDPAVFTSADGLAALNDPAPAEDRYAPVRALLTDPATGPPLAVAWARPGARVDPVPGGDRPTRPLPESLWQIYRTTGRVPTDIIRLAASAYLHPAVLADVAADLGMDPRTVSVLAQSLPDAPQPDAAPTAPPAPRVDRAARVRDVAVEWADRLQRRWSITADEIFSLFHFLRGEGHTLTVLDNGSTAQVTDLLTQWRAELAARQGRSAMTTPANSLDLDEVINSADAPGIRPTEIEDPPGLLELLRAIPGVEVTDFADSAQADAAAQWGAAGGRTDPADDSSDSDGDSTVDALTPARRSPAEPGAIGDPEGTGRPRLSAGELVGRALPGLGRAGGRDPGRLRQWVAAVEPDRPGAEVTLGEIDCVVRAYAAFVALHGRSANVVDNRVVAAPESMTVRDLQELLDGSLRPLEDWSALVDGLRATPGAMALIHLPANDLVLAPDAGPDRGHVFWLWSDVRDGTPALRVIDTQRAGLLADEAFTGPPNTRWEQALTGHGVRALLLDADGRPQTQPTPDTVEMNALALASRSPAEPGVLGLLETRHGTGSDAVAAALTLPGRHTGRDPDRLRDWVRTVEAQRPQMVLQHDVARAYGAFVAMHGRAANVVDSRRSPDVARLTLPELQQLLGGTVRPLTNVPGMLTALRNAPGAMALVHVPDRDRVFWLWSDDTGDAPVLRVVDPTHAGLLGRPAPSVLREMLRTPDVTVLALDPDGRSIGERPTETLPSPVATRGATVPWYLQDGALGQFTVLAAGRPASARVGSAAQIARSLVASLPVLPGVPAVDAGAIRAEVRREITRALEAPERGTGPADAAYEQYLEHWDERLTGGIHLSAGDHLVWILPVPRAPRPAPPAPEQDAKVYKVSFGSTSRGWTTDSERPSGGVSSWDTALGGISRHLTRVIFQLPDITFGSHREHGSSEGRKVLAGRQMFVTDSTPFQAGLAFKVYIDGRLWATTATRPASDDLLLIQFPTPYTDPANGQYRPARAAASTDGSPPRTSYADRVFNALATEQLIASWHRALRESLGAAAAADFARQGVAQLLNERTALNRDRRLLNGSDRATGLHHGSTTMSLHLMLQPMSLQHLGDTPDVAVRDDLGVIAEAGTSTDGSRHVALAGEVASYGISHIARALPKTGEKLPKDNRWQGTVSGELGGSVGRDAGVELGESVLNHTVFKRTDAQTRYRQQFEAVLVTQLSSGEVRPVVLLGMPGEVGVWQEQRGAYEQALLGAPMDGPIVAVPPAARRIGRRVDEEEIRNRLGPRAVEVLTGGRVVDPKTRRLMPTVETPQMRGRFPATPVPGEPLALATRRGLGPSAPLSLPGAEVVLDTATEGLLALSHRDELPVDVIEDLEIHIGRDAMEADPSRFQTGDPFQVIIDGVPYDVLVLAYVEELRDTSAYSMDVNLRALQGSSVEGSVGTSSGVGGGFGGGLLVPLPLQEWKLQLGRAELQGEWEWSQSDAYDGAVKHYRRTETTGDVTEYRYRTIYEVVLRRAVTWDHAAGPRVTYLIGDEPTEPDEPDVTALRTVLPDEHRLDRTVTADEQDLAGRVAIVTFREWDQANPIPYEKESAAGVFPFLPGLPEVAAQAAYMYAQLNNLGRRWFAEPLNWPRPMWGLGIASQVAGHLAELTDGYGWLIALPDEGGHHQAVRVQMRAFDPTQIRPPSNVEIEHYQQFSAGHKWSHDTGRSAGFGISTGPVFPLGGSGKADDPTDQVAPSDPSGPTRRQIGGIGSGGPLPGGDTAGEGGLGRLAVGPSGGYRWSREDGMSDESGYIDITRATYGGLTQHHRSNLVFKITAERWDGEQGEVTRAVRYLRVNLGKDFITPDRLAAALGLPGASTVTPASPPARRPVDPEPVRAWSHPERLAARAVLPAVTRALSVWKLLPRRADPVDLPPTLLVRALTARLRPAALDGQSATLTGTGLRVWQPVVTDGKIRFLLVQVTGDLQAPTADLPRDDVALTERSEAVTAHSTDTAHSGILHVGGRARARGEIASKADLAGEFRAEWQHITGVGSGLADETKDIMRLGIKQSHEFTQPITFRVDIGLTTELPELLRFLTTTGANLYRALEGLVLRDAGWWSRWSADAPVVGRAAWWERTTTITGITGDARLVVPAYLTIANALSAATGPVDGSWAPAGPSRPAAVPAVRVERGPHPTPPALNAAVLADPTFTPQSVRPIARAAHTWVKLVTEPLRRWPSTFDENHPPRIARKDHLSSLERTVAHHTSDRQLNRRFDELLEHRYQVGNTGVRLGLDLRGASFNVDLAPDGTVRPRGYTHKGRNYRQRDTKPSYEVSTSTSSSVGGGVTLRGTSGNVRTGPGGSGYGGFGAGRGYEGETSNVGERNSERRAQYHLMRYDATLVIYPPGDPGYRLLIDRDGGLFAVTTVRPDTTYQPPARFAPTVVDPVQGMEMGSRIDPGPSGRPSTSAQAAPPIVPVQAAPPSAPVPATPTSRLDESAFRRTVDEVAEAGQAASVRAGLLSLAECLALAERMVTRLYPAATPALHALRPRHTQEAETARSWLTGQTDWTPVTDWDTVEADLRDRPGATAVVLVHRPNQTVHHMFLAHTLADGRVLWADPGRAPGERVFAHPEPFTDSRLESPVAARTLVIGPDATVAPGRAAPESSSTARAVVDAPLGHDVRGSVSPRATWRSELPTAGPVVDLEAVRATLHDRAAAGDDPIPYRIADVLPGPDAPGLTLTLGTAAPVDLAGLTPRLANPGAVTAAPDDNGVTLRLSDTRDTWTDLRAVARHLRASGERTVSATVEAALGPGDHGALAGLVSAYRSALARMVGSTATTADALRASVARTSLNLGVLQAQIRLVHALRGAGAAAAPAWVGNHHYWWHDDEPADVSGEARRLLEIIAAVLPDHADLAALALLADGVNPGDTVLVGES
ncbi:toxin glutamine deamidase domain-containing protein [Micromonospora sp. WMMD1120]|uniref:toxin glutamine deamidase domain-containing protein n=1 Tax=Micromonospora sp. WMMD1120 TaxID=3016106 RepID=UPI002416F2EE|nr:toxin glutamine deamidase domain-containing protein [Micromonospora sp. WMMD1120]MDG4809466.1 toxin glutamine deamidase domain-containing protein [Micromonospora sp. WMMD1120]